jgi:hypothetical protein
MINWQPFSPMPVVLDIEHERELVSHRTLHLRDIGASGKPEFQAFYPRRSKGHILAGFTPLDVLYAFNPNLEPLVPPYLLLDVGSIDVLRP